MAEKIGKIIRNGDMHLKTGDMLVTLHAGTNLDLAGGSVYRGDKELETVADNPSTDIPFTRRGINNHNIPPYGFQTF